MFLAFSILLAWQGSAAPSTPPPLGPIVPSGANESFMKSVLRVEDALEKSDFEAARKAMTWLPKREFKIEWDDSQVPAGLKPTLAGVRDAAIQDWTTPLSYLKPEVVASGGDLKVSFADSLGDSPEGFPMGASFNFEPSGSSTRLSVIVSLKRGRPSQPATTLEIRNEIVYAIAAYMGFETTPFPGTASYRTDLPSMVQGRLSQFEVSRTRMFLEIMDQLTDAIAKKKPLSAARPKLQIEPLRVELPNGLQAKPLTFTIQVTNSGNAPVSYNFRPDCGCLSPSHSPLLDPGRTGVVTVNVDTVNFVGDLHHKFFVFSNDPDFPYREVPVHVQVDPLFQFVREGPSVLQMTDRGVDTEVILVVSDVAKFAVTDQQLQPNTGTVQSEPWEGEIALAPGQPKVKAKGYKFQIHLDRSPVAGRTITNLEVATDHSVFTVLRYQLLAQRGILAMPDQAYFGEIPKAPGSTSFILSRPGIPFKITKIESGSPFIKATWAPVVANPLEEPKLGEIAEYRIIVTYDGTSDSGPLQTTLTIYTDDPKQPKLTVPVSGTVK